jgi:hypothetical protein
MGIPEEIKEAPKPSALPEGCTPESYYKSEARPLHELKPLWKKFGDEIPFKLWLDYRDKARKDLFWLGKAILKKDLTKCHLYPCYKLFVQKNFDGIYKLGYTIGDVHAAIQKQNRKKEMLWLDPRGAFKSTLDGIDSVQWMLNCPDIRILILTGEYKLALAFMSEIKGYFYRPEKSPATFLHKLFPEYILEGKSGTSDQPLECPARIHNQKEPSLWVNAIVANLSGWHCDIRKMDDVVTDENSNSVDARGSDGKLKQKIDGTDNLVDEWGFTDIIGTRYYTDDYYGERMKTEEDAPIEILVRQCWRLKPPFIGTPLQEITEEMVDLLFPEKLSFKSLRQKLRKNERMFRCQQLNEPAAEGDQVTFTEGMLNAHLVTQVPNVEADIYTLWDTSFARTSYADYSAGVATKIIPGDERFDVYILEIIFGRWRPSELAFQYVQFEKKWKPKASLIERPAGDELLRIEMQKQAQRYGVALNIIWKNPSNAPDAKRNEIKGIETLISNDQFWFVGGQWIDETFNQLMKYTGERKNKGRKDDIPDALAKVQYFCPFTSGNKELERIKKERETQVEKQAIYNHIFDSRKQPPPPIPPVPMRQRLFGSLAR